MPKEYAKNNNSTTRNTNNTKASTTYSKSQNTTTKIHTPNKQLTNKAVSSAHTRRSWKLVLY
jgi:hypothetical protein